MSRRKRNIIPPPQVQDDWADLIEYPQTSNREVVANRKAMQLCRQVAEAVGFYLSGDCTDEELQVLTVVAAAPAPNSSRILITLRPNSPVTVDIAELLSRLEAHRGRIRAAIAEAIYRKRVPALVFKLT